MKPFYYSWLADASYSLLLVRELVLSKTAIDIGRVMALKMLRL